MLCWDQGVGVLLGQYKKFLLNLVITKNKNKNKNKPDMIEPGS